MRKLGDTKWAFVLLVTGTLFISNNLARAETYFSLAVGKVHSGPAIQNPPVHSHRSRQRADLLER